MQLGRFFLEKQRTFTLLAHLVLAPNYKWSPSCSFTFVTLYVLFCLVCVLCFVCLFFMSSHCPWITFFWFLLESWSLNYTFTSIDTKKPYLPILPTQKPHPPIHYTPIPHPHYTVNGKFPIQEYCHIFYSPIHLLSLIFLFSQSLTLYWLMNSLWSLPWHYVILFLLEMSILWIAFLLHVGSDGDRLSVSTFILLDV